MISRALLSGLIVAAAAAAQEPKDFDLDGNKQLDDVEVSRFIVQGFNPAYKGIDRNGDGEILRTEIEAYLKAGKDNAGAAWEEYLALKGSAGGITYAQAQSLMGVAPKPKAIELLGIRIRRTAEDLSIADTGKPFDKAEGALFSFTRNLDNGNNVWQVRGALLRPFTFDVAKEGGAVSTLFLVPSISFDRVTNADPKKGVDSLQGRIFGEIEFASGRMFDAQFVRVGGAYATDFDLESGVVAGEIAWLPVKDTWALAGTSQHVLNDSLDVMWDFALQLHVGETLSAGGKANLTKDESFVRAGPRMRLTVWPARDPFSRFKFSVQWQLFQKLSGDRDSIDLLDASISYKIDERGHLSLALTYQNGQIPLTEERTQTFTIGLTIKF